MAIAQSRQAEDDDDDYVPEEERNPAGCCKMFTKFFLSHIGLCVMVVLYSVAGGFIFQHLEQTNEKQECIKKMDKYTDMANGTVDELWTASQAFVQQWIDDNQDEERAQEAISEFRSYLVRFRDDTIELDYDGKDCDKMGEDDGPGYQWSFPGALLFSVTVITTIGRVFYLKKRDFLSQVIVQLVLIPQVVSHVKVV